jgi:hypothetical protein
LTMMATRAVHTTMNTSGSRGNDALSALSGVAGADALSPPAMSTGDGLGDTVDASIATVGTSAVDEGVGSTVVLGGRTVSNTLAEAMTDASATADAPTMTTGVACWEKSNTASVVAVGGGGMSVGGTGSAVGTSTDCGVAVGATAIRVGDGNTRVGDGDTRVVSIGTDAGA